MKDVYISNKMTLYKVISADAQAKDGGDFDYKPYLPNGNKAGKWTPKIKDIEECTRGYHVTPYWTMFLGENTNRVFEVEVKGLIDKNEIGVIDKYVCSQIRLIKEIFPRLDNNCNTGRHNTGDYNTGDCNTGRHNTGDYNTGDYNTGDYNTGDCNTGRRNTGDCNTGRHNTGDCNTGHHNTGDCNTGRHNTGDCNTGRHNTGDYNTGNYNVCDNETGFFNTKQSEYINIFNKPCLIEDWSKCKKPEFIYFDLTTKGYKESFIDSFNKTTKSDIKLLLEIPNFDYKIFEEISGITKKMIDKRLRW